MNTLQFKVLLLVSIALPSVLQAAPDRIAFVVGNSAYQEIHPLNNPVNDAADVASRLQSLGFALHRDRVHYDLTERQLRKQYNQFVRSAADKAIAFFYFAGHGMQFDGDPHVLPVDVADDELDIVKSNSVSLNQLLAKLNGQASLTVAVFDACRDIPNLAEQVEKITRGGSVAQWRGLSRPKVNTSSTLVAFSGGYGELVADGKGRNSPYTAVLLEYLAEDRLRELQLDVPGVFAEVSAEFRERHAGQRPEVLNQGVRPNRHFLHSVNNSIEHDDNPRKKIPMVDHGGATEVPLDLLLDREYYREAVKLGSRDAFNAYLVEFPEGKFARLVKLRLAELSNATEQIKQVKKASRLTQQTDEARPRPITQKNQPAVSSGEQKREKLQAPLKPSSQKTKLEQQEDALEINRYNRQLVQRRLNQLGFNVGVADGLWGKRTRAGIASWQRKQSKTENGYLNRQQYEELIAAIPSSMTEAKPVHRAVIPNMVIIPGGSFTKGSLNGKSNEKPRHRVTLNSFSMSKTLVTVSQWRRFTDGSGYITDAERNPKEGCYVPDLKKAKFRSLAGTSWRKPGFKQGDTHPVVCVSWNDAQVYAMWLSEQTGYKYRLPSESEWEYAASGGDKTKFYTSQNYLSLCDQGNISDITLSTVVSGLVRKAEPCSDGYAFTNPVDAFSSNTFALNDMIGNVSEWTQDCWHLNYVGAPTDGSAWTTVSSKSGSSYRRCKSDRMIRGGSWRSYNYSPRITFRHNNGNSSRWATVGFRVVRALNR